MSVWRKRIGDYEIVKLRARAGGVEGITGKTTKIGRVYNWYVVKKEGKRINSYLSERRARKFIEEERRNEQIQDDRGEKKCGEGDASKGG